MEFRTIVNAEPSREKISYDNPVLFIGSCFANSVGEKLTAGKMKVLINPAGTVYNPVSIINTLDTIISKRDYTISDLYNYNGLWLSFNHYTSFSSEDPGVILARINDNISSGGKFLSSAKFMFVTFGTARVFRWNRNRKIVSNCHKIPAAEFTHEILDTQTIISLWTEMLDKLHSIYPDLRTVFTISPVRHWKDGAHGNQVSKSSLFLAVEELLKHPSNPGYFPAYEIQMDELRDYRFYNDDMLHPSSAAVDYIWNKFAGCYFLKTTYDLWKEVSKITGSLSHKLHTDNIAERRKFAEIMLSRIDSVASRNPSVDLQEEKLHYSRLL